MFEELDEFSRKVALQVIKRFPEWENLAGVEEYDGEIAFILKVQPPSGDTIYPLSIDTFRQEVTVTFDAYHAHFWEFEDPEDKDAYSFVMQLLSDEYAVVSYWRDQQRCGSTLLQKSEFPSTNEEYPYANTIRIRSWSGQYNADISCIPRG